MINSKDVEKTNTPTVKNEFEIKDINDDFTKDVEEGKKFILYVEHSKSYALDYSYMGVTDIADCYPSIYTHTISWAIHTREIAKKERDNKTLIGNIIDYNIQSMSYAQTNGIPQGSILMDFIAEMVLGYADEQISLKLKAEKIDNYQILRYRDDYRIFANSQTDVQKIMKIMSEVLSHLNFKINSNKTFITSNIISESIKKDKMKRIKENITENINLQKQLLVIREYGILYPNCGSLIVLLTNLYRESIVNLTKRPNNCDQIISIVIDIMYNNPRTYCIGVAILSVIFTFLSKSKIKTILLSIHNKFSNLPNTDYLDIWLQRLTIMDEKQKHYDSILCQKIYSDSQIWNSDWLSIPIDEKMIVDSSELSKLSKKISLEEVDKFNESVY